MSIALGPQTHAQFFIAICACWWKYYTQNNNYVINRQIGNTVFAHVWSMLKMPSTQPINETQPLLKPVVSIETNMVKVKHQSVLFTSTLE